MGCGMSSSEAEVKEPKQSYASEPEIKELGDSNGRFLSDRKIPELKETKTEKSIMNENVGAAIKEEQQKQSEKRPATKIYLFGESATQRKIIQFSALPTPTIEILLSRNNNPTPVKYQPNQVILEESQQLCSSFMYNSFSHPPYNYMFATFITPDLIFLCGGANYDFDHVSNEAFFFKANADHQNVQLSKSRMKKEKRIGNNLMGNKFDKLAYMKNRRYSHMGVYLKVGKLGYVYVMGGRTQNDQVLKSCERYSIHENKWQEIADMNYTRSTGFSIVINQKIYVFGGYTSDSKRSKKIERYNPAFDSWEILNIQLHKGVEIGILLPCPQKNDILLVGGNVEFGSLKSVIRLDFEQETYCWDSDLKKQRLLQKGLPLLEQNVAYIFGGDFEDTVQKYSYKDKTWKNVTNLSYGTCISPDQINAFTMAQETINLAFDHQANSYGANQTEPNPEGLVGLKYIFGSDDYPCIYQLNTNKWVLKKRSVPMSLRLRSHMTTAMIKPGKIFIGGGIDCYFEKASRSAYIYYPGTNKAIEIAKMREKKFEFAACVCKNFVYIFGGRIGKESDTLPTCEKYDLNQDKWVQLPDMPRQRALAKAISTPCQKKIIILGGNSFMQTINEIDILDIQTDTFWTLKNILPIPLQIQSVFIQPSSRQLQPPARLKTEQQFEFLDGDQQKNQENEEKDPTVSEHKMEGQPNEKKEDKEDEKNVQNGKVVQIQNFDKQHQTYDLTIFNYNSYLKQHNAVSLTVELTNHQQVVDNKLSMKLHPFNIGFEGSNKQEDGKIYYFISGKGVFKWEQSKTQIGSQIVINQIHLLQMPLDRFTIA